MSKWDRFFDMIGARPSARATKKQLEDFESKAGLSLTPELREFYMICNGCQVSPWDVSLESLDKALVACIDVYPGLLPRLWGYFPFCQVGDRGWDVCCNEPLRNYVVRPSLEGDDARLEFRCLDSFLEALAVFLSSQQPPFPDDFPNDFDKTHPTRTAADAKAGLRLLTLVGELAAEFVRRPDDTVTAIACNDAENFARTLISENDVEDVIKFLDEGGETRKAARRILSRMKDPRAGAAIEASDLEMREFVRYGIAELRQAGIVVAEERPGHSPKVWGTGKASVYLDLSLWFSKRHDATVFTDVIQGAKEALQSEEERIGPKS